jgi:hypothetical protein
MRLPITLTIFAVAAAAGTATVITPRALNQARATAGSSPAAGPESPTPSPAAPTLDGGAVVLKNKKSGDCLDSNADGEVYLLGCNGGDFQDWTVIVNDDDTRSFRSVATNLCLDSDLGENATGRAYTLGCNGGDFQRFRILTKGQLLAFQDKASGLCLWNTPQPATTVACEEPREDIWWEVRAA